jgi:hypothetical protein
MHRRTTIVTAVGLLVAVGTLGTLSAQGRQEGQEERRGGTGAPRASVTTMILDASFVRPASQTGQTKLVQDNIGDPNLELKQYGLHESCLLTSGDPGSETTPFSVWSGECQQPFATLFRHKSSYLDLTGTAKIKWAVKTSGFHVARPVVKLADGTMYVGEAAAASVPMLLESEVPVGTIRWIKLDPKRVVTMGRQNAPFNEIWVPNVDLSRVDEVGFVDLMPASGHGTGGYIHISRFQVYGRAVPRTAPSKSL